MILLGTVTVHQILEVRYQVYRSATAEANVYVTCLPLTHKRFSYNSSPDLLINMVATSAQIYANE